MRLVGTKKHRVRPYDTQGRIFPFVTTNLKEYRKYSGDNFKITKTMNGLYFQGTIWVKKIRSPFTLGHEFIHHILRSIGNHDGGTRLFFDFINVVYEEVYGFIRRKSWRNQKRIHYGLQETSKIWIQLENIREAWNYWLDWQLCRN
jgi:hypothetical protein